MFSRLGVNFFIIALLSLIHAQALMAEDVSRPDKDVMTEVFANFRKGQVNEVSYKLYFKFDSHAKGYSGVSTLNLELKRLDYPLSIDSKIDQISKVLVNNQLVSDYVKRNGSFDIPVKYLTKKMKVEIAFKNMYKDGSGLHHFTDPADQKEYIYTDLEPYLAHSVFPCLDQPNLKATYALTVDAPKEWKVIVNDIVKSKVEIRDGIRTTFNESQSFSTYLFFLGAGHYEVWSDEINGIPLNIYARHSLKQYVDAERIFKTTKIGLKFFNEYFDYDYPFPKYDHIFSPELGPGAMENPGAVTMNERMIYRGPQTASRYMGRDNTILHEMAHMWFGDLVTMNWWNDLWLNESFATFMAFMGLDQAMGYGKKAWQDFLGTKNWAYWQDSLSTTHPIETDVPDTHVAETNFDGITYGKGASVLKQLNYYVGAEGFKKGVQHYFKKHAWGNTTRADFIEAISVGSNTNLDLWTKNWLLTAGLNKVKLDWECSEDGKISSFIIKQFPSNSSGTLSNHRTQLGLFSIDNAGELGLTKTLAITYSGKQTVITEAIGLACPDFIHGNYEDYDYASYLLDKKSLETAKALLNRLNEPLLRQMVSDDLMTLVEEKQLGVFEYLDTFVKVFANEKDATVLDHIYGKYSALMTVYQNYLTPKQRLLFAPKLEKLGRELYEENLTEDLKLIGLDLLLAVSISPDGLNYLDEVFKNGGLDSERRWLIIQKKAESQEIGVEALITDELSRDSSYEAKQGALRSRASLPTIENKKKYFELITKKESPLSSYEKTAVAQEFHSPDHPEITEYFVEEIFDWIVRSDISGNLFLGQRLFSAIFPKICIRGHLELSLKNSIRPLLRINLMPLLSGLG